MKHSVLFLSPVILLISLLTASNVQAVANAASASGLFQPYTPFSVTGQAKAVGIGDFNHDGLQDAAVSTYEGNLYIYLQNASGGLNSPVSYAAGTRPEALAVGDLNNDGWDDVVVTNYSSNTLSLFVQQANGTLTDRVTYSTNSGPDSVAVGDLNNDGRDDVVVSHWTAGNIAVFIQNTSGTLNTKVAYSSPQAGYDDIAIGDVNGDGLNDVVKMNGQTYSNPDLSVYTQTAGGTLSAAASYSLPGNILGHGISIGDVTGDGKSDVALSYGGNSPTAFMAVFAQAADGTLQSPVSYSSYDIPEPVEIADVNLDDLADIITVHGGWSSLSVYPQQDDGSLGGYSPYNLPYPPTSHYKPQGLAIGDINHDTAPDILIADYNYGLLVLYHTPIFPAAFNKTSPANGAVGQSLSPTLNWSTSTRATSYEVCYDTVDNQDCDGSWTDTGTNTSKALSGLSSSTTYYWQVRAVNSFGTTYADNQAWRSFTTGNPPTAFTKSGPASGSLELSTSPTITWQGSMGVANYEVCYDTIDDDACNTTWTNIGSGTNTQLIGLLGSTSYYWQVRAVNPFGTTYADGSAADWWTFTTESKSAPTDISLSNTTMPELQPLGTGIGTFSTTDINAGDVFTYTMVSGAGDTDNASFAVLGNTLVTADSFFFGTQNDYSIRIRSTDQDGLFTEKVFTVTVTNQDATFGDVAESYWAWQYVEHLFMNGITSGCNLTPHIYCPEDPVTRAQMAVFLLKAKHGPLYTPPAVGASTGFNDVAVNHWAAAWIKQLSAEGITGGCGNGNYCPETNVTRAQMAVFLLKGKHVSDYVPPAASGALFADVSSGYWSAAWIEQLAAEGITGGCGNSNFCPEDIVTRAQMAVFLVKAFDLP